MAELTHLLPPLLPRPPNPQAATVRMGPRPLPLHLGLTLSAWLSLPAALQNLKSASPDWKKSLPAPLTHLLATRPEIEPYLLNEIIVRARHYLAGIRAYRHSIQLQRNDIKRPVIWQQGTTRVYDYAPDAPVAAPRVLMIPSHINRASILDLHPGHSFLETLVAVGCKPLLVDWDLPSVEESVFSIDDYITRRLLPILESITADGRPAHVMGYCMGGLLATALAALRPATVRSLAVLATPWDFHAEEDTGLAAAISEIVSRLEGWIGKDGLLPVDYLQSLFLILQPWQGFDKFSLFAKLDPQSAEAERFIHVEDWLNDGVPLSANVARQCFIDWYQNNNPAMGRWTIGGITIDPRQIRQPAYAVVPVQDRLVPPASALALATGLPLCTVLRPNLGHIGIMASTRAPRLVWAEICKWLAQVR